MKYEYFTSVFSIDYQKAMGSGLLNKSTEYDPFWPEWRSLPDNPKYKSHMEEMGQKGWELVSVQPILRGIYRSYNESAYGYSLTAGYYFFWKKQLSE